MKAEDLFAGKGSIAQQLGGAGWDTTKMEPQIDPGYDAKEFVKEAQIATNKPVNPKMAILGTLNQTGFGIPGALVNLFDPKAVDFAKNDPSFQAGEGIGSFISSALPVTRLAGLGIKGIGALAQGSKLGQVAGKVGTGLEKLGSANKGFIQAGRGATDAALAETIRSVAENKSLPDALVDIGASTLGGLGTGFATGGLTRLKKGVEELAEKANASTVALAAGNTIGRRDVERILGLQKGRVGIGDPNAEIKEMADWLDKGNPLGKDMTQAMDKPENYQEIYEATRANLGKYDPVFEKNPEIINKPLLDDLADAVPKIKQDFAGRVDKTIVSQTDDIAQDLLETLEPLDYMTKINKVNDILNDTRGATFGKDFNGPDAIRFQLASELKKSMDKSVEKYADSIGDPSLKEWKKSWGMLVKMKPFILRDIGNDLKFAGLGSNTFEKTKGSLLGDEPIEKTGMGLLKGWLTALGRKGAEMGGRKILASSRRPLEFLQTNPNAQKVVEGIQKVAELGGPLVAREVGNYLGNSEKIDEALNTLTSGEVAEQAEDPLIAGHIAGKAEEDQNDPNSKFAPAYMEVLLQRMMNYWDNSPMSNPLMGHGKASLDNQNFLAWAQGVKEQTGFAPDRIAGILFPNPVDKEKFKVTHNAVKALQKQFDQAGGIVGAGISTGKSGLKAALGGGGKTDDKQLAAGLLKGNIADLATKAGISSAEFNPIYDNIMRISNPAKRREALTQLLQKLNPEGVALHQQAGLL